MREESGALALVKDSLETLGAIRKQSGGWLDSEVEEPEQSCVFKIMESLEPFFLANRMFPVEFARLPVEEEILLSDLKKVIEIISRDGFSPSPYLYIREEAEFVDCAALALRLAFMVGQYVHSTVLKKSAHWAKLLEQVPEVAAKAYEFLLANAFRDKGGLRWAGTGLHLLKKTSYCNVYFTREAVRALAVCLREKEPFSVGQDEKTEEAVREASRWILGRVKDNTVFGDEAKTRPEINYSMYGLDVLLECYEYLEERQKDIVLKVFNRFVERIAQGDEGLTWLNYIDVPLKEYTKPIFYEDRSGYGNIITVLCKGRDALRELALINERFFEILNVWYRSLVGQRDSETFLWEQGNFLICYTARAVEGLLYFIKYGEVIKFELSEQEVLEAFKKTVENPQIQQIFLREIAKVRRPGKKEEKQ